MEIHSRSHFRTESWQKLAEGFPAAQKIARIWWKISRLHEILIQVDWGSPGHTEFSQQLMEDGMESWRKDFLLHENRRKLMEGLQAANKFDRVQRKFYQLHRKLTAADRRSLGGTIIWRKFSRMHLKLTGGDRNSPGCMEFWRKFSQQHRKFTEVVAGSPGCSESCQKLTKCLPAIPKVDGISQRFSRPYGKLTEVDWSS